MRYERTSIKPTDSGIIIGADGNLGILVPNAFREGGGTSINLQTLATILKLIENTDELDISGINSKALAGFYKDVEEEFGLPESDDKVKNVNVETTGNPGDVGF